MNRCILPVFEIRECRIIQAAANDDSKGDTFVVVDHFLEVGRHWAWPGTAGSVVALYGDITADKEASKLNNIMNEGQPVMLR